MIERVALAAQLAAYADAHGPITVGLAGAGQMGTDIVVQLSLMPGVRLGVLSEIRPEAAVEAVQMAGLTREQFIDAGSTGAAARAIEAGKVAITGDYRVLCGTDAIDVVIDATGNPNVGTLIALEAMKNGKHIVMLNVEADITIGRYLKQEARKAGVVFTGAAGD